MQLAWRFGYTVSAHLCTDTERKDSIKDLRPYLNRRRN